jgi:hypothetical protein
VSSRPARPFLVAWCVAVALCWWTTVARSGGIFADSSVVGFRSAPVGVAPNIMISWRGLPLNVLPALADRNGVVLTMACAGLTILCLPWLWLGAWHPRDSRFPARFLATMIITLLTAYHSHIYGAALLLVPGADLAIRDDRSAVRALLLFELLTPPFILFLSCFTITVTTVFVILMTVSLLGVLGESTTQPTICWHANLNAQEHSHVSAVREAG